MRKPAIALFILTLALRALAADGPPPPLVAPPTDDVPPPLINIDSGSNLGAPPTEIPTSTPEAPTAVPTELPTAVPTAVPTPVPSLAPTLAPALAPSPVELPEPSPTPSQAPSKDLQPPMVIIGDEPVSPSVPTDAAPDQEVKVGLDRKQGLAAPMVQIPAEAPMPESAAAPTWIFTPEAQATLEAPVVVQADAQASPTPEASQAPPPPAPPIVQPSPEAAPEAEEAAGDGNAAFNDTVKAEVTQGPSAHPDDALNIAVLLAHGKELEAQGRYYEAWNTYQDLNKQYPKDKRGIKALISFYAKRLTERAKRLEKAGRYYEAANLYRDIVMRDAKQGGAWWGLGSIFFHYHKHDAAIYCFEKVLKLEPDKKGLREWLEGYKNQ